MFQVNDIVDAIKGLAANDERVGTSYCQVLEEYAKALDFQSYHHLLHSLKNLPEKQFGSISLKLMRDICATKLPSHKCPYYEFQSFPPNSFSFYSRWAGWDKYGDEVRVPRELEGRPTVVGLRNLAQFPVYVVESPRELLAWLYHWRSTALIPEELAREFFASTFNKDELVEKNPPIELIKQKTGRHAGN